MHQSANPVAHARHVRRPVGPVLSLVLCSLCSCETWDLGRGPGSRSLTTVLEPASAAWVAAEAVRWCFPGADPVPRHVGAPVARLGADRFVVHYARSGGGSYRLRMNGRLLPPPALNEGPVSSMGGAVFRPGGGTTRAALGAPDRVSVTVERDGDGSRLSFHVAGHPGTADIGPTIALAIELAEAIERSRWLLETSQHDRAAQVAAAVLNRGHVSANPHTLLRARLRIHHALAQVANGRLAEARGDVARSLASDPDCRSAQLLRIRLDARLARESNLRRHLRTIGSTPGQPALTHWAAIQRQQLRQAHAGQLQEAPSRAVPTEPAR